MKKFLFALLVALLLSSNLAPVSAQATNPPIPKIDPTKGWAGWVIDTTGTVPAADLEMIQAEVKLLHEAGFQTAVAIFEEYASPSLEFATEFINANGIGDKDKNNGIGIVISLKKKSASGDPFAIGVGLAEGTRTVMPSSKAGRILDEQYQPKRKTGAWTEGLVNYLHALYVELSSPKADEIRGVAAPVAQNNSGDLLALICIVVVVVLVVFVVILWLSKNGVTFDYTPGTYTGTTNDNTYSSPSSNNDSSPSSPSPGGGSSDGGGVSRD